MGRQFDSMGLVEDKTGKLPQSHVKQKSVVP